MVAATADEGSCLVPLRASDVSLLRLILVPHAGAGASAFRGWEKDIPPTIDLFTVQLPGRERRFTEPSYRRIEPLVDALAHCVEPLLDRPFMLFGHSMGVIIALELAHEVLTRNGREPVAFVASGYPGPRALQTGEIPLYLRSDAALLQELRRMGGTPAAVFESPDLLELYLPVVRADLEICETWAPRFAAPLNCPIIAVAGRDDESVNDKQLEAWRYESSGPFEALRLPGGHFYALPVRATLIEILVSRGLALVNGRA
jgi:medium-chain acyl-[acyl-carrier-protein] hydrolase